MARALRDIETLALAEGLSKRLCARLGALERRGIFLSDVLLEVLVEDQEPKPIKRLLLSPMLNNDETPSREFFATLIAESGEDWFAENPLQLIEGDDLCVIALEDEEASIEFEGEAPSAAPEANAETAPAGGLSVQSAAANLPSLNTGDVERVFGAEALAQIKLTLLTSTSENEKIEAIRKLSLSPIAGEEKLQLFLIALRDTLRGVRAEASRGLGSLGLEARIADNLARACQADDKERLVAISNLSQLLQYAGDAEEALMVGVATGLLVSSEESALISTAIALLEEIVRRSTSLSDEVLSALHRRVQDLLLVARPDVHRPLRKLYSALIESRASLVTTLIERSLEEVAPKHLRNFLLSILLSSPEAKAQSEENIRRLLESILESDEIDPSFNHMRSALRELGSRASTAVLSVFEDGGENRRVRLLETLADLANMSEDDAEREAILDAVLSAFDDGSQRLRNTVYDSSILRSGNLTPATAARAAVLLLADIHEHELEATQDIVTGTILQLRGAAFEPTLEALESSPREVTIEHAAKLLGQLATRWPEDETISAGVEMAISRIVALLEAENFPNRPVLYPALGQLCAHRAADPERVREIAESLHDEAGKSSATYDIIEALGWISAGDSIDDAYRLEMVHVLLGFLELDLPKISGRIRQLQGEDVLEFGRETTAYTDLIPRLIAGLGRIIDRDEISKGLWGLLLGRLGAIFKKVASYEIVWAPAATLALAAVLGRAGESSHASGKEREEVVELLLIKASILSVVRVLGRLCMSDGTLRMNHLATQVFDRLDRALKGEDDLEVAEKRQILGTMLALLTRKQIGNDELADKRIRSQILDHLGAGMKMRLVGLTDLMRQSLADGGLGENETEVIERLLSRAKVRGR